jgi:hypothetical protein
MDGADGSTTFTDSSSYARAVTASGNAQISTGQSKFGGASGLFDGSVDNLQMENSTELNLAGTPSFTIEAFVRVASFTNLITICARYTADPSSSQYLFCMANGTLLFHYRDASNVYRSHVQYSYSFALNTWYHVAVTFDGATFKLFLDGAEVYSGAIISTIRSSTLPTHIALIISDQYYYSNCSIDELRFTKGVARAISGIPTSEYPNN